MSIFSKIRYPTNFKLGQCFSFLKFVERSLHKCKETEDCIFHKLFEKNFCYIIGYDYRLVDIDILRFLNCKFREFVSSSKFDEITDVLFNFQSMRRSSKCFSLLSVRLIIILSKQNNENDLFHFVKIILFFYYTLCYFICMYGTSYAKYNLLLKMLSEVMIELTTPCDFVNFQYLNLRYCCIRGHCDYELNIFKKLFYFAKLQKSSLYIFEK
jgi:hypothetical protein